jgi:hypothetical protein
VKLTITTMDCGRRLGVAFEIGGWRRGWRLPRFGTDTWSFSLWVHDAALAVILISLLLP